MLEMYLNSGRRGELENPIFEVTGKLKPAQMVYRWADMCPENRIRACDSYCGGAKVCHKLSKRAHSTVHFT